MPRTLPFAALCLLTACSTAPVDEPSLRHRTAEEIDPRVPIPNVVPAGTADAALLARIDTLVGQAQAGRAQFDSLAPDAEHLAVAAGPEASESWIAAEQALSRLVSVLGIGSTASADLDALASDRLKNNGWISPADQAVVRDGQDRMRAVLAPQEQLVDRLREQLAR